MLPNFICPGAARSATTALYYLLIQHPQIYMPPLKETRFFSRDYEKGADWYEEKYYANVKDETAVGDISPVYLIDEGCPQRIHDTLGPETKLIFMLRNPVERAYSHYCMLRNHQFEDLPFEQAIALGEEDRIAKSLRHYEHVHGYQYLKESSYSEALLRYLERFGQDQVKYVLFEEFADETQDQLLDILGFLEVDGDFRFDLDVYKNPRSNSSSSRINRLFYNNALLKKVRDQIQLRTGWKTQSLLKKSKTILLRGSGADNSTMNQDAENELYEYFTDEIARLETILGRDLSMWKKP